jgi:hypothetical protein
MPISCKKIKRKKENKMNNINLKELANLTTKDLLALYNAHASKPIARFGDHTSGFRRTKALLESLGKLSDAKPNVAPTSTKARAKVQVAPISNPQAIKEYHSVLAAFIALGLPIEKHQRLRRQVKLNGKATIAQFIFVATY